MTLSTSPLVGYFDLRWIALQRAPVVAFSGDDDPHHPSEVIRERIPRIGSVSPVDLGELPVRERPPVFASTKFVAPPPPIAHVQRHDLLERIDNAGHIPLTLVIGSPGSGKSSLLSAWFHTGDPVSLSWLSTDRGDHDPVRFWRAFIAALQRIAPGFGADAADLITLDRTVSTDVLESLLADDTELDRRVTLVIDDVHLVSPETARHLHHLVERGLRNLRLVIGSRHDPAIGLHRLRLRHQVVEVRESDLRFGLAELLNCSTDSVSASLAPTWMRCSAAPRGGWPACRWQRWRSSAPTTQRRCSAVS